MSSKDAIKVMFAGGLVVIATLGVQHLCKVREAKIEHNYEMQEENLRYKNLNAILEKFPNMGKDSEVNNDKIKQHERHE